MDTTAGTRQSEKTFEAIQAGQEREDRLDGQNMTARTGPLGEKSRDRKAGSICTSLTVSPDRTERTGQDIKKQQDSSCGQGCWGRTAGRGELVQDNWDRTVKIVGIVHSG